MTAELAGANCTYGGTHIEAGVNTDGTTVWGSSTTVTASSYVCNASAAWVTVTNTSQQAVSNTGYVASNSAQVAITLPSDPAPGDVVMVSGAGAGGWSITPNSGQSIVTSNIATVTMADTAAQAPIFGPQYSAISLQYVGAGQYIPLSYIGSVGNSYVSQGGLTWSPANTALDWGSANTLCAGTINGVTGWRLPTSAELNSLAASGAWAGRGWTPVYTWSSTPNGTGMHFGNNISSNNSYPFADTYSGEVTCVK